MKSDQELKKTFKVSSPEDGIFGITFFKEVKGTKDNVRQIQLIEEEILEIFSKNTQKKYKGFLDLLALGKGAVYTSPENRKIWARLASHEQLDKCAIIGSSVVLKVIAGFVISLSGRSKDIKWFSNKEKAFKWLKEKES